jgi:hypothetical protein
MATGPRSRPGTSRPEDASYYGHWFNPTLCMMVEYCEGDVTYTLFDSGQEFVDYVVESQELLGYEHIDDWDENWVVPIERDELDIYLSYMRDDMVM